MTIAAVLLAAGGGTRWTGEGHKLTARIEGRTIIDLAVEHADGAGCDELVVVDGALDLTTAIAGRATVLHNPQWRTGQGSSLAIALAHCLAAGHEAAVVALGDQPFLSARAWQAVATTPGSIVVATYAGRRGHPIKLAASTWPLIDTGADEGARELLRSHSELVVELACEGNPDDIDTVGDLERWSSTTNSP